MARPEYSRLYNTAAWRRKSRAQLQREPLCRHCMERGEIRPAEHADHVVPHRGDPDLFWRGETQSLCLDCHSRKTAVEQGKSVRRAVAEDGTPDGWD